MDINQNLTQNEDSEKSQIQNETNFKSVNSYLKSKNALFVMLGLGAISLGLAMLLHAVFLANPITNNITEQENFDPNLPSKGFSEKIVPVSGIKNLVISDGSNEFFQTNNSRFLIARNSVGSYVYQVSGSLITTVFSTPRNLKDVLVYKSNSVLYSIENIANDEIWIKDETGASFQLFQTALGERVQSFYYDTRSFVLYALIQLASQSAKLASIDLSGNAQSLNISGNISPSLRFVLLDGSNLYLSDSKVCFAFSIVSRQYSQEKCEGKIFAGLPIFRFRPELNLFFSSNFNSTIDQYNFNISDYVRIFNGSTGEIVFPNDIYGNNILLTKLELSAVSGSNFFEAGFESLSFFDIQSRTFQSIYDVLPTGAKWNNFKFFVSNQVVYAIDYSASPVLVYRFEPGFSPVSIPVSSPTSMPVSFIVDDNKWRAVGFLDQGFTEVRVIYHFPYFHNDQNFSVGF